MKVILQQDIANLGKEGDVVEVADGYGRNYLLPRRLAVAATSGNLRDLKNQLAAEQRKSERARHEAASLGEKLKDVTVTIKARVGAGTKLYGSVTSHDIVEALEAQHQIALDRRKIHLDEPIRSLGSYTIPVKLQRGISVNLGVEVVAAEEG